MTTYTFPSYPALDPTTETLVRGASGQVYDINDTSGTTPLSVTDLNGLPLSEIKTTEQGITDSFRVEDHPEVIWRSGPYVIPLSAPKAMRDAAESAATSAAASASTAASLAVGVVRFVNNTAPDESGNVTISGGGSGGTSDHGALSGLGDDDHPQYHNDARGDARYYLKSQVDTMVNNAASAQSANDRSRANHTGTQPISTIQGLQTILDGLGGTAVNSVAGKTGAVTLVAADISDSGGTGREVMGATSQAAARTAIGAAATSHTHTATAISDSTSVGRGVLTAASASAARSAIGAGTSDLTLGTTGSTALRGNAIVINPSSIAGLPDGTLIARTA